MNDAARDDLLDDPTREELMAVSCNVLFGI